MKKELENLKINPVDIKRRVNKTLNADLQERKLYMKYKLFKTALTAALITAITAASAFAVSPVGKEAIGNIISYFQSDKAEELSNIEELAKYNEEIGKSCSKDGYTITLDNVAADDNFIHIFYTIKSDSMPFYDSANSDTAICVNVLNSEFWTECVINNSLACSSNHNSLYGYFADPYTYKAAEKYNVAVSDIPDVFTVELYADKQRKDGSPIIDKLYDGNIKNITNEDREKIWYVSTEINKSIAKSKCVTKDINVKLPWTNGAIAEKVVFSPFGNQLVMVSDAKEANPMLGYVEHDEFARLDQFALYDENGTCLDMLNTDLKWQEDGSSRNSLEFLKGDSGIKQLKFVPMEYIDVEDNVDVVSQKIEEFPLIYEESEYGKVVVTNIRFSDGEIDIDYYHDGFIPYNPGFVLTGANGEDAEPGDKFSCILYTDVHYETNSYTARYVYDKLDENGNHIPADESVSAEALKKNLVNLGIYKKPWFRLDFENTITVDFK